MMDMKNAAQLEFWYNSNMTYYEEYLTGHVILPRALFEHFDQIFPSADDFLVWLYFFDNQEIAPSQIAQKIGKTLAEVNKSITNLTSFGALKVEISGDMETMFDISPALLRLDDLTGNVVKSDGNVNDNQLQALVDIFEAEFGVITPMNLEELRTWLFEDKFDSKLIQQALREAVNQRKVNFAYIKGILRRWKSDGIHSVQSLENQKEVQDFVPKTKPIQNFHIPNVSLDGNLLDD